MVRISALSINLLQAKSVISNRAQVSLRLKALRS